MPRDLANAGYIAIAPEYRLDHSESFFLTQSQACLSPPFAPFAQILDVKSAIEKARRPDPGTELDGKVNGQVAAVGGSAGGTHALWCAATDTGTEVSNKFDCAVLLSGGYDFDNEASLSQFGEDSANFKDCVTKYCGTGKHDPPPVFHEHLQMGSPIHQVTANVSPLFIIASKFDSITPPQYDILTERIRQLGHNGFKKRLLTDPENASKHAFEYWDVVKEDAIRFLNETLSR